MRTAIRVFIPLLAVVLLASVATATTVQKLTEEQMTEQAAVIVEGRCSDLTGQWVGKTLYTLATIDVGDALKGQPGAQITIAIPGGVDLDREVPISFNVPGAPVIRPDENLLLFLEHDGAVDGGYSVVGFFQGKYSVVEGPGGKSMAVGYDGADPLDAIKQRIRRRLVTNK